MEITEATNNSLNIQFSLSDVPLIFTKRTSQEGWNLMPNDEIAWQKSSRGAFREMSELQTDDFETRFAGIARLYGHEALARFRESHVCVVGVGGVGSWVVEALARSGIGALTMIDLDDVCVTNVNRQLPALDGNIGRSKVGVLAERVRQIQPACQVRAVEEYLTESNAERLLLSEFDYVVDAVDRAAIKVRMIARCRSMNLRVLTMGGAGGRRDPLRVRLADLNRTSGDRLLRAVRTELRANHRFAGAGKRKHHVLAVFSDEPQTFPWADGTCRSVAQPGESLRMDCASGYGAVTHVTATFAMVGSGAVLEALAKVAISRNQNQSSGFAPPEELEM